MKIFLRHTHRNRIYKTILFLAAFCISAASTFAQDVITMKNGDEIQATVQEVGIDEVKYKNFDNPDGPNYTIKKSDVFMIKYANGSKDIFKEEETPVNQATAGLAEKYSFLQMEDEQQEEYLQVNYPDLYERFHKGQNFSSVGRGLRIPGLILVGGGLLLGAIGMMEVDNSNNNNNNNYYNNNTSYTDSDTYNVGYALFCVGAVMTIVSIPFSAVGSGIKRSVQNDYKEKYLGARNSKGRLDVRFTGNGLGLAYVF